jgi:hypothetical protein
MRGLSRSALLIPSLSMLHIVRGEIVHRCRLLANFVFMAVQDVMALAVERWMIALDALLGEQDDRETRNHNPWGDDVYEPYAFSAGAGE